MTLDSVAFFRSGENFSPFNILSPSDQHFPAYLFSASSNSMDELCFRTKAIVQQIPQNLSELEQLIVSLNSTSTDKQSIMRLERKVSHDLETVFSSCQRLSVLSNNEPSARRSQALMTIDQIQSESKFLRSNLQSLQRKRASKEQELMHRASLLSSSSSTSENGFVTGSGAAVIRMDQELDERSRLSAVSRRIDEMLMGGSASLVALQEQGSTLKGAKRRALDLINTLGLSNTVMRLIQRRSHQDKIIFYLLCTGTLILMLGLWRYLRG